MLGSAEKLCEAYYNLTGRKVIPYNESFATAGGAEFVVVCDSVDKLLICGGSETVDRFSGAAAESFKLCDMSHENRLALNKLFAYTIPQAMGREKTTFGFGDRLGITNYAQLQSLADSNMYPILAQQSLRELSFTNRTYKDVIDAAAWAVFKCGWKKGYGADGDHLKHRSDIAAALEDGVSMITLDCSDVLHEIPNSSIKLQKVYGRLPQELRRRIELTYLNNKTAEKLGISFDETLLMQTAVCYCDAIGHIAEIYENLISKAERVVDIEVSLDETKNTTTHAAHFFVANELNEYGIAINSMAPRFVGEFQKGINYIGNVTEFKIDIAKHAKIADCFGYKLSIHSGSDKFAIFPYVGKQTGGRFHIKTSGTSWLEAVRVIAKCEPQLYRDIHMVALAHFEEARKQYVVFPNLLRIPAIVNVADAALPEYLDQSDSRQLLHITYGFILADEELKKRLYDALIEHKSEFELTVKHHMMKHLTQLGMYNLDQK